MKKVCILSSVHPVFDTRIFHKQAHSLVAVGYDVTLIAQHEANEMVDGIKILALPKPENRFSRIFLTTSTIYRIALQQKADVYHFHDPELLPTALLLKSTTKCRIIYDVHEDYPKTILSKYWLSPIVRRPIAHIFNWMEKWGASRIDCIIAATDDIAEKFRRTGNVALIKNYPMVEHIIPRNRHGKEHPLVIYAGVLSKERGIDEIVQAMQYLNDSRMPRLVLYGNFDSKFYQETVHKLKGFDKVEYRGWLQPEALWQEMGFATIGIICFHPEPNHIKAMPNKLFEYMAAGLPVIVSNFPLWRKIVEENGCGLTVNPLSPQEIAKAVRYLLDNPGEAIRMGENGRKLVLEKYSWETEGRKLLSIYQSLLEHQL